MPQISVIVPVYKVEKYLKRCVDSILSQTFTDFELILVDDGSPDGCPQICDQYAQQDARVYVIHQQNGGLSAARNAGIDWAFANSNSQWLTFVDSDDWIHPCTLEALLKAAQDNHVDVSICGFQETYGEEVEASSDIQVQLFEPESFYIQQSQNAVYAWGKLYKKKCFTILRYPLGKLHEDAFVIYKILFHCEKVAFIDIPFYAYFQNSGGITRLPWTPARLDEIEARFEQITYFEQYHFAGAKRKAVQGLLWILSNQLISAKKVGSKKHVVFLCQLLKKQIKKYKKELDLSPSKTSYLYETAYPKLMKCYWIYIAILKKLHIKRS